MEKTEKHKETKDFLWYLLLAGIIGLAYNFNNKFDRYYVGEALITKYVIVEKKPAFISIGRETSRYTFKGVNFKCQFWISHGALDVVNDDKNVKKEIEHIKVGDTIYIKVRKADEINLSKIEEQPRVIELVKGNTTLISADEVRRKDMKWMYINFGFSLLCLVSWIILKVRKLIQRGNMPVETIGNDSSQYQ